MILLWKTALILGGLTYAYFIIRVLRGLARLRRQSESRLREDQLPSVSVVIAARNEEDCIERVLRAIQGQDYTPDRLEIIVIDDRSTDATAAIVEGIAASDPRVRLLRQTEVPEGFSPKKAALEAGINAASGEIIAATDADCEPPPGWLKVLAGGLTGEEQMVIGQARFEVVAKAPLWQRMQALDFQSIGLCAAGLAADGMAFTCNGASLAFRRDFFRAVNGYEGVRRMISGDDELLLAKAAALSDGVGVAVRGAAVVPTRSVGSLRDMWHQRVRWGSKGLHYAWSRKLMLMGMFLYLLSLTLGLPMAFAGKGIWGWWLIGAAAKAALDWAVFHRGALLFGETFPLPVFAATEIVHAPAMVIFAVAGHFSRFEWKGQRFRSQW